MPPRTGVCTVRLESFSTLGWNGHGQVPVVSLGTLSSFWVPVMAHAMQVPGALALPSDLTLHNRGAIFSLSRLVQEVAQL